ncbi:hypothetical protein [Desulfohalovibrio reitneri]|uniref:hypothetical protein n=1 Tax=Desulfohalovibrio reitneri TaxID=1307759 RepID=UPI0004A7214C|nr:hypothetical protein [Desulfohalovibrio reitneri]
MWTALLPVACLLAASPAYGGELDFCLVNWRAGPAATNPDREVIRSVVKPVPEDCRNHPLRFTLLGMSPSQRARCTLRATYASGGSSAKVKAAVDGRESVSGELETVEEEPGRSVEVTCLADDPYREMHLSVCVSCDLAATPDPLGGDEFRIELGEFLSK